MSVKSLCSDSPKEHQSCSAGTSNVDYEVQFVWTALHEAVLQV